IGAVAGGFIYSQLWEEAVQPLIRKSRLRRKNGRTTKFLRLLRETVRFAKPDSSLIRTGHRVAEFTRSSRSAGETMHRAVFFSSRTSAARSPDRTWCFAFRRRCSGSD